MVAGEGELPRERPVLAIGEAKAGETIGARHRSRLERVRALRWLAELALIANDCKGLRTGLVTCPNFEHEP